MKLQLEAEQKLKQEEARLQLEQEQRQKLLEEEEKKLAEQNKTAELKLQKEKERPEREELEKQLEYARQREAAIEQEFRDRLSSVGSGKSLKGASLGKLTERQIAGAQIKRELQAKLKRITEAFKYVQATGTKVGDETLQRYEQIRKKIARELRLCLRFIQAEQEETPEGEKPPSPTKHEEDQQVPSVTHTKGTCVPYR